jgi:hypothetical protein
MLMQRIRKRAIMQDIARFRISSSSYTPIFKNFVTTKAGKPMALVLR